LLEKGIANGDTIHIQLKIQAGSETYPGNSQPKTDSDVHHPHCENMQVLVTTYDGKTSAIPTKPTDTVESLKSTLAKWQKVPVWRQRIVFAGTDLQDEHTLEHYKLGNNSSLAQMLRMHGGMDPYEMLRNRAKKQAASYKSRKQPKTPRASLRQTHTNKTSSKKTRPKEWLKQNEHWLRHKHRRASTPSLKPCS
jgi:hypothetical protein